MNFTDAAILGLVQGLTEFLPVSSSGHLFLTEMFLGLSSDINLALWLHLGSLLAVVVYFWRDIVALLEGLWAMVITGRINDQGVLALKLGTATAATVPLALLVNEIILLESLTMQLVGVTLLVTAGLIALAEFYRVRNKDFSWTAVIILGIVQGLAVIPGLSRSGLTIATLVLLGINRHESARISFLLSIPTIVGAAVFTYVDAPAGAMSLSLPTMLGVLVSAVAGWFAIKWMIRLVEGRWVWFIPYCAGLGLIVLFI